MDSLIVPWLPCILASPAGTVWRMSVYDFCENVSKVLKGTNFSGRQSCGNILSKSEMKFMKFIKFKLDLMRYLFLTRKIGLITSLKFSLPVAKGHLSSRDTFAWM